MKTLSSLEIRAIVDELQELVQGKVDNIYQPDNTEVVLSIHRSGVGRKHIRILPGTALYVSTVKRKSPRDQINFCRFLRKRLRGGWLRKVEQKGFERIVELHLECKQIKYIMICEFFSKGNVILCDENYVIISALQVQLWKDRKIKARVPYVYPPARKVEFDDYQDFALYLEKQEKESIVKKLATLNLGGLYAEEVCARSGVNKDLEKVSEADMKKLFAAYKDLFSLDYFANIVDKKPVPFKMASLGTGRATGTYNIALDEYYKQFITDEDDEKDGIKLTKQDKQKMILNEQEKQLIKTTKAIGDNKEKGDWIYANYTELDEYYKLFKTNKVEVLKRKGVVVEGTNFVISI
jgi:predicted ribosome quality control (RQC) complex YloA/Tae2 family protein